MEDKLCKNCGSELIVKQTKRTPEQLKKSYYYTAYYFCPKCHKLYHNDKFKVENKNLFSDRVVLSKAKNEKYDAHIWTDGACTRNGYDGAKAAWAFVSGKTEKAGLVEGKQTNNTAEGFAIYHALLWAAEEKHKVIKVYSDSQITLNNLTKSPYLIKENRMIFELIEDVISANGLTVDYEKVPAHADNINNNRADRLANTLAGIRNN
ncbi:MAG TPA: RNase H family protein [Candidatus Limnocylindrales bacterium]|nr:RNase H family protein [Candidatus Limnocylindrales bacterium]